MFYKLYITTLNILGNMTLNRIVKPHKTVKHDLDLEHNLKLPVDMGLFFFGFANAGVELSGISNVTWIVLSSLIVGKTVGIFFFSWIGVKMGFPLPKGMGLSHLFVAGIIAGLGLTVALFVAGEAFKGNSDLMDPAKMGAVMSAIAALIAILAGRALGLKDKST